MAKTMTLADSLNRRAPEPSQEYITTLGLNRQTGLVNDPFKVGNMPSTHVACAFSRLGDQLSQARAAGWIPFEADQVTKNEYDGSKAFIPDYDVDNGFVVVGFGERAMVMCYANKSIIAARRARLNTRWNSQFASHTTPTENPNALPKKDTGYTGGFTTDAGNQAIVGYQEETVSINPDNPTDDLFRQPEGGQ